MWWNRKCSWSTCACWSMMVVAGKSACAIELWAKLTFLYRTSFSLETVQKGYSDMSIWQTSQMNEVSRQGKQLAMFIISVKPQISSENQSYGKLSDNVSLTASQYLGCLMSLVVVNIIFLKKLMLYIMKCYHLGVLPKSVDQYLWLIGEWCYRIMHR